jgi:hypothetical protein
VAVSATFDDVADEWRAAVAADDRLTLRRVISRLVRRIEVTPIERDGRRTSQVAIIFAFEPESSVRPLLAYASAYVALRRKLPPLELAVPVGLGA